MHVFPFQQALQQWAAFNVEVKLERLRTAHLYILTFLFASLSATILLKLAGVQYLEIVFLADLFVLAAFAATNAFRVEVSRPTILIASSYAAFMAMALILSVVALQRHFTLNPSSLMKEPFVITIARETELALDVFYMLYLADRFRDRQELFRFGLRTYFAIGVLSAAYCIATLPLNLRGFGDLGTYGEGASHRMRGFYNEGGPYGVYLLGVFLCAALLLRKGWVGGRTVAWVSPLFAVVILGSRSKSAALLAVALALLAAFLTLRAVTRALLVLAISVTLVTAIYTFRVVIQESFEIVGRAYALASTASPDDLNIVAGRVSGAVLGPRMIAEHPWAGIGWGNYVLVRNNPEYRHGAVFVDVGLDAPGLGPVDYVVDLGVPLFCFLLLCEGIPVLLLSGARASKLVVTMAAFQPLSMIFGAHLNISHPWFVGAVALAAGSAVQPSTLRKASAESK